MVIRVVTKKRKMKFLSFCLNKMCTDLLRETRKAIVCKLVKKNRQQAQIQSQV